MATTTESPAIVGKLFSHASITSTSPAFDFSLSTDDVGAVADAVIKHSDDVLDLIAAVPLADVTYANVAQPLADLEPETELAVSNVTFLKDVSPDGDIRKVANNAQQKLAEWHVKAQMRIDIAERVALLMKDEVLATLNQEQRRFVERTNRDHRRLGLLLDEDKRKKVEELKTKITKLGVEYSRNVAEVDTKLSFTAEELDGMPEAFIASLSAPADAEAGSNLKSISLSYPHVIPVLENCKVEATRRKVEYEFNRRAIDTNVAILEEMVVLRAELAAIRGYGNNSDYRLEVMMAKNPATVVDFLDDLSARLKPLAEQELKELKDLKAKEAAERGEEPTPFSYADFKYYARIQKETKYDIDMEAIKEYFPMTIVVDRVLALYQQLLSLKFEEVAPPSKWHESVRLFKVINDADGELVGHFFLDLFPREGKYSHAAVFPLLTGCQFSGTKCFPTAAMVCNFTPDAPGAPSTLTHDEFVTFLHEFGHVMHHLCSKAAIHRFSGFSVEQDFVEAPSQMLENWCWQPSTLQELSAHKDDGRPLPEELAKKLAATKLAGSGLFNMRQITLAKIDQALHTISAGESVSTEEVVKTLYDDVLGIPCTPGTNVTASFGHLAGGYDSLYFSYLKSEVIAADMFQQFKSAGLRDPVMGGRYRDLVLAPGGSKDAIELVKDFLGREPTIDAFLESKGLSSKL